MVYFIIFIALTLIAVFEHSAKKEVNKRILFFLSSCIVLIFCSFRYEVGYDYVSYYYIYKSLPDTLISCVDSNIHGEYLFLQFFILLKSFGIPYPFIVAICQSISMLLFLKFINEYSPYKSFSVLILFSWYFTYIFGILRQGLAISLIWGIAYPYFEQKKQIKYYITIFAATLFHTASCIAFLLPAGIRFLRMRKIEKELQILILLSVFVIAFVPNPLLPLGMEIVGQKGLYIETNSISYLALFNRVLIFVIVFLLCKTKDEKYVIIKYVYLMCIFMYVLTAQSDAISSRLAAIFKLGDIILIPYISTSMHKKYVPAFLALMFIYSGFIFMKYIAYMASLIDIRSAWNYPYKMLFFE
jgi:hypothetical protein